MKAVEFESTISATGQISLPPEILNEIPVGEQLRVLVLWEGLKVDPDWRSLGRRSFEAAYGEEDSVYEQLINDTGIR